ncbi:hypothetical protein [Anaerospora hongkongensis]|uniref:hypothetical protein n=1 Tax=Anaerospora hongkongensis TaxID=244830 RepID=UPI00289EE45D|nr:hypothetical protein [Anaerospora hongkongensis]
MHFSNFFGLKIRGHEDIDFVDVNLKTDTRLFIDPCLIELTNDSFSKECTRVLDSFFKTIFDCCASNDNTRLYALLDFGHEPNETKLGLSQKQSSGKGASPEILFNIFKRVAKDNLIGDGLIQNPMDLCLFIQNFAEDRMSDLVTNALRKNLYDFTKAQCEKHDVPLSGTKENLGSYWNPDTSSWETLEHYPLKADNRTLILVPKVFVCPSYIYSVGQYLQHKILCRRQEFHQANETSLAKVKIDKHGNTVYEKPSKKSVYAAEVKGTNHKQYVETYSRENPDDLIAFRKAMMQKLSLPGIRLTDETLDRVVYKLLSKAS